MLYEGGFTEQMMVWRVRKVQIQTDMDNGWMMMSMNKWISSTIISVTTHVWWWSTSGTTISIVVRWSCALGFVFSTQCCRGIRVSVWHRDTPATTILLIYLFLFTMSIYYVQHPSTSKSIHQAVTHDLLHTNHFHVLCSYKLSVSTRKGFKR